MVRIAPSVEASNALDSMGRHGTHMNDGSLIKQVVRDDADKKGVKGPLKSFIRERKGPNITFPEAEIGGALHDAYDLDPLASEWKHNRAGVQTPTTDVFQPNPTKPQIFV